jgi:hypothetical protein
MAVSEFIGRRQYDAVASGGVVAKHVRVTIFALRKALTVSVVTVEGKVSSVSLCGTFAAVWFPSPLNEVSPSLRMREVSELHPTKAFCTMDVTDEGIVMLAICDVAPTELNAYP